MNLLKMFSTHKIGSNDISIKNLILLFLTIIFGFGSVLTLAQISIPSTINNAWQTIGRVTITSDGTDSGTLYRDFNADGNGQVKINPAGLQLQTNFAGKVLGIDANGNLIYVNSTDLVVSGGGGGTGDGLWTGGGSDIWNINPGNVGIGTTNMSGKAHIKSAGQTELYLEETTAGNAANINLKNTLNTWMVGGFSERFYIGNNGTAFLNITLLGKVGIGTTGPKADLQVVGNIIGGDYNNSSIGIFPFIGGGSGNYINGDYNAIVGGYNNSIVGADKSFAGGTNAQATDNNTFIRNSSDTISFQSDHTETFIVNAPGGVGIQTNNPSPGTLQIGGTGIIVFEPQPSKTNSCNIQGAVYYYNSGGISPGGYLCYCDGVNWKQIEDNKNNCI